MILALILAALSLVPLEGTQQAQFTRCAASPYQVGDGFPKWGYIIYTGVVYDKSNTVVGWIYSTDHQFMLLQPNGKMSAQDLRKAGFSHREMTEDSLKPFVSNPWKDLKTGPCPEAMLQPQHSKQ